MEFICDLRPEEYQRAMHWHQFASSLGKRINDYIGWMVLILAPLMIAFYLVVAREALSLWFWPMAIIAILYAAYSTLLVRYQIRQRARLLRQTHPVLAQARYKVHAKGIHLTGPATDGEEARLFLPWKEIQAVRELPDMFLFFVSESEGNILIVPKRCLPDVDRFRALIPEALRP